MEKKYNGLNELIQQDGEANSYFQNLPEYVQEMIRSHENEVNSYESLRHHADNYTKGDT